MKLLMRYFLHIITERAGLGGFGVSLNFWRGSCFRYFLKDALWQQAQLNGLMTQKALALSLQTTAAKIYLHTSQQSRWMDSKRLKKAKKYNSKWHKGRRESKRQIFKHLDFINRGRNAPLAELFLSADDNKKDRIFPVFNVVVCFKSSHRLTYSRSLHCQIRSTKPALPLPSSGQNHKSLFSEQLIYSLSW